ncbi:SV2B protein, partial [Polypterus senegalus]
MDDRFGNNTNFYQGSNTYSTFEEGGEQDGYYHGGEYPAQEEDAASDATEGHDEDDEIYEGEYQGIPHPDDIRTSKKAARAMDYADHRDSTADKMQDEEQLAHQYEAIIEECGHGRFQWTLFFVAGLALMADGVECFVVAFALPSAEKDICMSNADKGALGLIVYVGMMLGAFIWGGLADKVGRRRCLIIALTINSIFSFLSSFVQGYGLFLFFRLISGIGIGGSIPIVYAYFSEFLCREKRGEHLSWLCMFWMIGGIYASSMAWGIIPHYAHPEVFQVLDHLVPIALPGGAVELSSWTVESMQHPLAATPAPNRAVEDSISHGALREVEATLPARKAATKRPGEVSHIKTPKQEDEFIEIQSSTGTWYQRWLVRIMTVVKQILENVFSLFSPQFRLSTLFMAVVWFTMAFSYYGLTVWFPDMIKHLQNEEYKFRVKHFHGEHVEHLTFNFTLENQIHNEGKFINAKYVC